MFVPMREEVVLCRAEPKKAPKAFVDIDVPRHGRGLRHPVDMPRHVNAFRHCELNPPRRRNSLHLPLTDGFHAPRDPVPRDPAPRHHHHDVPREFRHHHRHHDVPREPRHVRHLPVRPARHHRPDPPRCALRCCGKSAINGSRYCLNDTCRDSSCAHRSRVWGGYCDEHGCGAGKCCRRRAITKAPVLGKRGVERFVVSKYCGVHSCRSWGCGGVASGALGGFCEKHYVAFRKYC